MGFVGPFRQHEPIAREPIASPQIIAQAVWLHFRFPLSLRLVEEIPLERGFILL